MNFVLRPWQLLLLILAGWINRDQQDAIEYLLTENQVLREKLGKRRILVLLQGSVVEGGGLPTKGRLRSSVQLHQRASVRYVACLIHV